MVRTDGEGRYSFPPHPFPHTLVVLHDEGFALKPAEELARSTDIQLEPWARVEGTVRVGTEPAPGAKIELEYDTFKSQEDIYLLMDCRAETDAEGKYVMEQVPPMEARIGILIVTKETGDGGFMMGRLHGREVLIEPGQKAVVNLGGAGRPVVGQLITQPGLEDEIDWTWSMNHIRLIQPEPPYPSGLLHDEKKAWLSQWRKTPEGTAHQLAGRSHSLTIESDGSFRIDDVTPGTWELEIRVYQPPDKEAKRRDFEKLIGRVQRDVVVPDIPGGRSDEPLDLGKLELVPDRRGR
jgi:hypothetical protein